MPRRVIAAVAALALAAVGTVLLLSYVVGADRRAMAGQEPTDVLVVVAPIAEGTPAEQLGELVAIQTIAATAVVPGGVSSLDSLAGQVATTDLEPGEQLLASRFADPAGLGVPGEVEVPVGMQQVSVGLDAERALGGNLVAGDTVGIFVSFADAVTQTHLVLHQVLVTRVQGGIAPPAPSPAGDGVEAPAAETATAGYLMVTVALVAPDAETLVFAAEHGTIWLSLENSESSQEGTRVVNREIVYE
ncbi:MAG: RcpC/CpaB family pilus assembly protein [Geodermatophilaceae bacterium]